MFMLGAQAYLIMQNIFEAPFWFLLPVSMVVCNDIMAYLFGELGVAACCLVLLLVLLHVAWFCCVA